ncbi:DUF1573 domain-containing protein [uncultured Gimesia sp.]|uniref:DUF1573 domain-containing protein n=1 Tax=uncultured Gimesia sp. TaxID=1678688 RepID=UPI00263888A6|nr:DUF1573 domain-containing protein [uncultured Gimesia sp.]
MLIKSSFRFGILSLFLFVVSTSASYGQEWAQKMFDKDKIDFGVIARGSDAEFRLKIKNIYKDPVHISNVRTTCGCSAAEPSKNILESGEEGYVQVTMDTKRFQRRKDSNVIVTIDAPQYAEIRIPITAYIRTDVVFTPGAANFGSVEIGKGAETTVALGYAGREDWAITGIESKNSSLTAKAVETSRAGGRVNYNLVLTLAPGTPLGPIREQIMLSTNDVNFKSVPLLVEAKVESDITITPQVVSLGMMVPGQEKTVNVVLRGKKPFEINKIECESDDEAFKIRMPKASQPIHVLPLTITPPNKPGDYSEEFTVTIAGRGEPIVFKAFGKISDTKTN